ncbi:MAG: helix-turn-helix protein [Candidatus Nomurabacteria bacterium]|nr:helix-turn-helix protein [Candidatus Nomurabacteria bacterium]
MVQAKSGLSDVANKYNLHSIKTRRSYSLKEVSVLLQVDRKTCSRWIKDKGLKVIAPDTTPILIMGADLKTFLLEMRCKNRVVLGEDELYCLKCHCGRKAKKGSEQVIKTGKKIGKEKQEQFKKIGNCDTCGTPMHKFLGLQQKD